MTGTSGTRSGGLRKGRSPCELLGDLPGFLYRRCRNLRPCLELGPEREDFSPGLTWILGYFWSLPRRFSPHLEWGHSRALSSRALEPVSVFPARRSRDLWLSLWAFPPSFPNRLSHRVSQVPPLCGSIICMNVEAVQGKQVSLAWTETSGGLWEWWHDPGVPLAFPVESACS